MAQLPQDGECSGLSTVTLEAQEGDEEITDVSDDPSIQRLLTW